MLISFLSRIFRFNKKKGVLSKFVPLGYEEFKKMSKQNDVVVLDVRTKTEFKQGHIPGAYNLDVFSRRFIRSLRSFPRSRTFLIYCRSGNRSLEACKILLANGYKKVFYLQGGILNWKGEIEK